MTRTFSMWSTFEPRAGGNREKRSSASGLRRHACRLAQRFRVEKKIERFVQSGLRPALHLHLEGAVTPATLLELRQRHGDRSTLAEVEDPKVFSARNMAVLRNTNIVNFFDLCAITLPLPAALPVGLMLIARNGQDRRLLCIAAAAMQLFGAT